VTRTRVLLVVGAAAVLVSAWVHFYLYFRGGYRGIAPESSLGITVSRAFIVNAIAGVVIAEALVLATRFERLAVPAAAVGVLFALGTLGAFLLSRYDTLLGYHETNVTTEAVVALVVEIVALIALVPVLVTALTRGVTTRRQSHDPGPEESGAD
jgi:hypothetical protein